MKVSDIAQLEVSLTAAVGEWWDKIQDSNDLEWSMMPVVGGDVHTFMAQAAIAVLRGVSDSQEYIRRELNGRLTNPSTR